MASPEFTITDPSDWQRSGYRGFIAIIKEDRQANKGSWLVPAVQALAVHRFGEWVLRPEFPRHLRHPALLLYRAMFIGVRNVLGFEITRGARIGRRVTFYHQHGTVIHPEAIVGDDCVFLHGVTLGTRSGDVSGFESGAPRIGAHVTLGAGCVLLGPVRIGDWASVGPNAVVTTDVPTGASVVAPPSRVLRLRPPSEASREH